MTMPVPTPIFRFFHMDNLPVILDRGGFHAPNCTPDDGCTYRTIHNVEIQSTRRVKTIHRGPGGVIHDYVPFYFGPRSPMLYQLHTGWVEGYTDGQKPLIYAVSTIQAIRRNKLDFVFSDGHGIAAFTDWYDDFDDLDKVDWEAAYATWWRDTPDDMDRQRRKQAEFLVHQFLPWRLVERIGVVDAARKAQVTAVLAQYGFGKRRPVEVRSEWYY